jgi:hypothetical protein
MSALAKIVRDGGAPGWTLPNRAADGGVFAQDALFAAAAVQPLVEGDEQLEFEPHAFLAKVLELSTPEASA